MKEQIEALHKLVMETEFLPFKDLKAGALLPASQGVPTPHRLNTGFLALGSELLNKVPSFPCMVSFEVESKKKIKPICDFVVDHDDRIHTNDLIANLFLNHYFYIVEQYAGDEFLLLQANCKHSQRKDEHLSIELFTIPTQAGESYTNLFIYHFVENGKVSGGFWNLFSHEQKQREEFFFHPFNIDKNSNLN